MAIKILARCLPKIKKATSKIPIIGVFATGYPRVDPSSRKGCHNIVKMVADMISDSVFLPDKTPVPVVYSDILVDGEV